MEGRENNCKNANSNGQYKIYNKCGRTFESGLLKTCPTIGKTFKNGKTHDPFAKMCNSQQVNEITEDYDKSEEECNLV